jgi:Rrf2 family transcriptional regulator, cysteine metabolism repressor
MRLSTKSEYGFLAILDLALHSSDEPVQIHQIARRQTIPKQFLDQILLNLKKAGLVVSTRGRQGGYQLSRPPRDITVLDIYQALEGPVENRLIKRRSARNINPQKMVLADFWQELMTLEIEILKANTLEKLCEKLHAIRDSQMYYI